MHGLWKTWVLFEQKKITLWDKRHSVENESEIVYLTYLLIYALTLCSTVLLDKLTGLQPVKKFPAFYVTRKFITTFTSSRHLSLSWASSIQSIPPHPTSWRSILILSSHVRLGLPIGFFPPGFPTKNLYPPLFSPIHATCPAHLILDFITCTILGEQYRTLSFSLLCTTLKSSKYPSCLNIYSGFIGVFLYTRSQLRT